MVLPEDRYGEKAVSRGDDQTRLLTLRNLGWEPITCKVRLDEEIGLSAGTEVELRQYHPTERIIGTFKKGDGRRGRGAAVPLLPADGDLEAGGARHQGLRLRGGPRRARQAGADQAAGHAG